MTRVRTVVWGVALRAETGTKSLFLDHRFPHSDENREPTPVAILVPEGRCLWSGREQGTDLVAVVMLDVMSLLF